jgi:hypothetical protein
MAHWHIVIGNKALFPPPPHHLSLARALTIGFPRSVNGYPVSLRSVAMPNGAQAEQQAYQNTALGLCMYVRTVQYLRTDARTIPTINTSKAQGIWFVLLTRHSRHVAVLSCFVYEYEGANVNPYCIVMMFVKNGGVKSHLHHKWERFGSRFHAGKRFPHTPSKKNHTTVLRTVQLHGSTVQTARTTEYHLPLSTLRSDGHSQNIQGQLVLILHIPILLTINPPPPLLRAPLPLPKWNEIRCPSLLVLPLCSRMTSE